MGDEFDQFVDPEQPAQRQRCKPVRGKAMAQPLDDLRPRRDALAIAREFATRRKYPLKPKAI